MEILEKIDKLRRERGWSVNNLAMEAMLTQSTVNNLFSRGTEPKISTLRAICNAFGMSLSEFFADDERPDSIDNQIAKKIAVLSSEQKHALLTIINSMKQKDESAKGRRAK